jgi:hypothetical protein
MFSKVRLLVPTIVLILLAVAVFAPQASSAPEPGNRVLAHALDVELGRAKPLPHRQHVSSGALYAVLEATGELDKRLDNAPAEAASALIPAPSAPNTQGCQNVYQGNPDNVRANQDCSYRRQAETVIAINPTNPRNLVSGQNDSRIGFNHCGYNFSFDGGKTWGDMVPPFWGFIMRDGSTSDACSDPTVTFDSSGNAYIGGILFDVNGPASAFVVSKSNAQFGGSFFHSPAAIPFQQFRTDPLGIVASDNNPNIFHDKEFIVADATATSPKANYVYGTWTRFDFGNGNSPIYFSQSVDGGATWSPGIEISGNNPAICTDFSVNPGGCDQDQGSHPVVGKDGTVYVSFGNGNLPGNGINQVLFVSCPASKDCSQQASWTAPVKVGDLIGTHPINDTGPLPSGCPPGRRCLPPNGYRVPEFTSISTSVADNGNLFVSWSDFRNGGGACTGSAATATPPCNNDVFYAYSTNGGTSWSSTFNITAPAGNNAQWQPWSAVSSDGTRLWVAYYDRGYGNCEFTGCNDITLARINNPASPTPNIKYKRITTGSMPNLIPANNPLQAGFLGDYMWVATDSRGAPYIVWSDTRGRNGTVEEDTYFARPAGD